MSCDTVRRDVFWAVAGKRPMLVSRPVSPSRITAPRGTGSYGSREPGFIAAVSSGRHTSFSLFSSTLNRWTQSERESPGVQSRWSCWSYWIPVRAQPIVILIVEVMPRPHQVEAVDPTQPVGASVKTGCYPVSGRVDDAPVALAERGAPSLGFAGSDPANGFFFAFHRSLLMTSIVRGDTHIASAICRSDKPALRYFVRRFSSRPFELARIALTSSAPSISIIFGDPFSMTLLHLLSRPVGRMS